jgi:hypothetical protein
LEPSGKPLGSFLPLIIALSFIYFAGSAWIGANIMRWEIRGMSARFNFVGLVLAVVSLAGCAPTPAPAPLPPVVVAPPRPPVRPSPPLGASASYTVPPIGVDGVRQTPNRGISANEAVWNFRAAINVAALNCRSPSWDVIATNYNQFLNKNKATLTKISRNIEAEYKAKYPGQNSMRVRDTKLTDLYNYFSLPAIKREYCDAALIKSQQAAIVDYKMLPEFSANSLADIDGIFIRFFDAYAQYERDLAAWNQKYAPQPMFTSGPMPQPVAAH